MVQGVQCGGTRSAAGVQTGVCDRGVPVPSPFEVQVAPPPGTQKVRAWGPGLERGVVGQSADFVVEAIGTEVGTLGERGHGGTGLGTWGHVGEHHGGDVLGGIVMGTWAWNGRH